MRNRRGRKRSTLTEQQRHDGNDPHGLPEILLLDEGIGAGDASFWEKANERLDAVVAKAGILLLASHSLELVRRFCAKAVLMERGRAKWTVGIDEALEVCRAAG